MKKTKKVDLPWSCVTKFSIILVLNARSTFNWPGLVRSRGWYFQYPNWLYCMHVRDTWFFWILIKVDRKHFRQYCTTLLNPPRGVWARAVLPALLNLVQESCSCSCCRDPRYFFAYFLMSKTDARSGDDAGGTTSKSDTIRTALSNTWPTGSNGMNGIATASDLTVLLQLSA
eukprot:SAG11_NODE_11000_length_790_cov_1.228654_1_plen_172_part_00